MKRKGDSIATPRRPVPQSRHITRQSGAQRDYRAIITIYRANTLSDAGRGVLANWLHAQANFIANDLTGRQLASTFHARRYDCGD
jgi:hypothetical protein